MLRCKPGHHYVRSHRRLNPDGTKSYVEAYCRKNPANKAINFNIDPLLIKAMIAIESSFREKVITDIKGSSATGLMQVTKSTMAILAGNIKREIRSANVEITQEEALEGNVNIAAGTRWLVYKITSSPVRKTAKTNEEKTKAGVKFYYSWNSEGENYMRKVWKLYEASK